MAATTMRRINALMRIVSAQLSALDTLPPQRFAEFRGYLGSASGGQRVSGVVAGVGADVTAWVAATYPRCVRVVGVC